MSGTQEKQGQRRFVPSNEMRRHAAAETDRLVREQIAREAQLRSANMARLREERLARESTEPKTPARHPTPEKPRACRRINVR